MLFLQWMVAGQQPSLYMKIAIIIQARMGSTRLPGKVLKEVNNEPMLLFQYKRLQEVKMADLICIATTTNESDNVIVDLCLDNNIPVFRGSENNVLKRYIDTANHFNADLIVRINSDCPLIDSFEVDAVIKKMIDRPNVDYVSNILEESFPVGMHIEVFSKNALEKAFLEAKEPDEKEHVTPYIYRNSHKFNILSVVNTIDLSHHRWTVDYQEDLVFIQKVVSLLSHTMNRFKMMDVVELVENTPDLQIINHMYKKKQNLL